MRIIGKHLGRVVIFRQNGCIKIGQGDRARYCIGRVWPLESERPMDAILRAEKIADRLNGEMGL